MDSIENGFESHKTRMPTGLSEYRDFFTKLFEDSPSISSLEDLAQHFSLQLTSYLADLSGPLSSIRQLILTEIDTKEFIIKEFEDLHSEFSALKTSSKDLPTPTSFPSVKSFLDLILNNFAQVLKIYSEVLNRYMEKITGRKNLHIIKSLGRARTLHTNTEGIDKELQKTHSELLSRNPSISSKAMSIDERLLYENYELKQKLIQTGSSLLHLNCELLNKGDTFKTELLSQKIKSLSSEVTKANEQNQELSLLVEDLKTKNSRLLRVLSAQESLRDKLRSLNFAFSAQGKRTEQLRNSKSKIFTDSKLGQSKESSKSNTPQIQSKRASFSNFEQTKNGKGRRTVIENTKVSNPNPNPNSKPKPESKASTDAPKNPFENSVGKIEQKPTRTEAISDSSAKIIEELRTTQAKLIQELHEKERFIQELRESNADYAERMQEYEEVIKQEDSILKESEQQLAEALDNNQQYMIKINGLTEEMAQTKEAFLQVKLENSRLVEENSILYEEKSVLMEEHEELQKIKEMSYASLHKMMSESEIMKIDEHTFNEEPILEQMNTINDLKEELEFAKKHCQESKTKMFEYQEFMQTALEENEQLKKLVNENKDKLSECLEEIHHLKDQKNELNDSLAISEENVQELRKAKEDYEITIKELNKKVRSLESLIVELKSKKN